jgi:dihydropteroate synthase
MHSRGPMSKQAGFSLYPDSGYGDVVAEVRAEWRAARERAVEAGLPPADVWFDPGLGFAKNARQSFELLARLDELTEEGVPVVVGASRKSFLASLDGSPPARRLGGSIAAGLVAVERGAAVLRVHDVWEARQALDVARSASPHVRTSEVSHA